MYYKQIKKGNISNYNIFKNKKITKINITINNLNDDKLYFIEINNKKIYFKNKKTIETKNGMYINEIGLESIIPDNSIIEIISEEEVK